VVGHFLELRFIDGEEPLELFDLFEKMVWYIVEGP
jgi:hypothetical protein